MKILKGIYSNILVPSWLTNSYRLQTPVYRKLSFKKTQQAHRHSSCKTCSPLGGRAWQGGVLCFSEHVCCIFSSHWVGLDLRAPNFRNLWSFLALKFCDAPRPFAHLVKDRLYCTPPLMPPPLFFFFLKIVGSQGHCWQCYTKFCAHAGCWIPHALYFLSKAKPLISWHLFQAESQ